MTAILFVCLGNICRSPLAEGILRHKMAVAGVAAQFEIDSAGCGGWHVGRPPDPRSVETARRHGIDISGQKARQLTAADFEHFDLVLGMDRDNVHHLMSWQSPYSRARVGLYLKEALGVTKSIPDPYHGKDADFEAVFALCEKASDGLLKKLANA